MVQVAVRIMAASRAAITAVPARQRQDGASSLSASGAASASTSRLKASWIGVQAWVFSRQLRCVGWSRRAHVRRRRRCRACSAMLMKYWLDNLFSAAFKAPDHH